MNGPPRTRSGNPDHGLIAKRAFDLVVSAAGLVAALPLMAAVAVAIRAGSEGPVIFRQERVGRHGTTFRIHKFRTLRAGSAGPLLSPAGDDRVTRVGAVLRRTKLDEIPQLFDVFTGRMSIVGPRPEVPRYVAMWPQDARDAILSVRPGITDRASIALRHEAEELAQVEHPEVYYVGTLLPRKVAMYASYVRSRTFLGDLRIIAETARAVLPGPTRR